MEHKGKQQKLKLLQNISFSLREKLNLILAERTGQSVEVIARDTDRDNFMTAERAKEYGLIDHIITRSDMKDGAKTKPESESK